MKVMHCGLFFYHQDPTLPHPLEIQQFSFKKCRNKVHCMTDEMKTLQRITTEDATPKQVCNRLA